MRKKSGESLTKPPTTITEFSYESVFRALLSSKEPLSSYQIKQETKEYGYGSRYTYTILRKLISSPSRTLTAGKNKRLKQYNKHLHIDTEPLRRSVPHLSHLDRFYRSK